MVNSSTQCKTRCENIQELESRRLRGCGGLYGGFLVLEVMFALLILSASSLIVAWYHAHTCLLYGDARHQLQAVSHARSLIARIEQGNERGLSGSITKDGYDISWRRESFAGLSSGALARLGLEGKKLPAVARVTATVVWAQANGQKREIVLATIIRIPEKKGMV